MADYAEQILQAVDVVVQERLRGIKYDTTIECQITDAKDAEKGQYIVSNGSAVFVAYSTETNYRENDTVLVSIPNGDYNKQKTIIGKKVADQDVPYVYQQPFEHLLDITGNIIAGSNLSGGPRYKEKGYYANHPTVGVFPKDNNNYFNYEDYDEECLWHWQYDIKDNNVQPYKGYDRLGLRADFSSWLSTYQVISGNYGLFLQIQYIKTENSQESNNLTQYLRYYLDSDDFYGNPYAFDFYYTQEAVFDISDISKDNIIGIDLFFYQDKNFKDKSDNLLPAPKIENLDDFSSDIPNLYIKDPYICFGYDINTITDESALLITQSDPTYNVTRGARGDQDVQKLNIKYIELRWIHKYSNGYFQVVPTEDWSSLLKENDSYEIRWYRYKNGVPSPDMWAGMFWELAQVYPSVTGNIQNEQPFFFQFEPDITNNIEQIKVIIIKNNVAIARSNILTFTNEREVPNAATQDLINALSIQCGHPDENGPNGFYKEPEQGNYFIYKKGNELIDSSKGQECFSLTASFDSAQAGFGIAADKVQLTEAELITWMFPYSNSMIRPVAQNQSTKAMVQLIDLIKNGQTSLLNNSGSNNLKKAYQAFGEDLGNRQLINQTVDTNLFATYNPDTDLIELTYFGNEQQAFMANGYDFLPSTIAHYFIRKVYSPKYMNNLVQCSIIKNKTRYYASRQLNFGQSGTSGSAYTLVVNFNENQNAVTITPSNPNNIMGSTAKLYTGANNSNVLVAEAHLYGQNGEEVIDFNDVTNQEITKTITWDWKVASIADVEADLPLETGILYYPVLGYSSALKELSKEDPLIGAYLSDSFFHGNNFNQKYYIDQYLTGDLNFFVFNINTQKFESCDPDDIENGAQVLYAKLPIDEATGQIPVQYQKYKMTFEAFNFGESLLSPGEDGYNQLEKNWSNYKHALFINYNGVFIINPFEDYNEAQIYYYPVFESGYGFTNTPLLYSDRPYDSYGDSTYLSNKRAIIINNNFKVNNHTLTVADLMRSVNIARVSVKYGDLLLEQDIPIPIRLYEPSSLPWIAAIDGATYVRYTSSGEVPDYYKNPYIAYVLDLNGHLNRWNTTIWNLLAVKSNSLFGEEIYYPSLTGGLGAPILQPVSVYLPNALPYGVVCQKSGQGAQPIVWNQPILVYQDNYPSSTINAWDGKSIVTDNDTGSILTSAISAGKKESDNSFSGVMIGDWSRTDTDASVAKQTGVYGFNHGAMSYAFKQDGTAFIGKDGKGRIFLNGESATLYSAKWLTNKTGMLIDLDDGYLHMNYQDSYVQKIFANAEELQSYLNSGGQVYVLESYTLYNKAFLSSTRDTLYYPNRFIQLTSTSQDSYKAYSYYYKNSEGPETIDTKTGLSYDELQSILANNPAGTTISINSTSIIYKTLENSYSEETSEEVVEGEEAKPSTFQLDQLVTTTTYTVGDVDITGGAGINLYGWSTMTPLTTDIRNSLMSGSYYLGILFTRNSSGDYRRIYSSNEFDSQAVYYIKTGDSDFNLSERYITLGANENKYPLSIGIAKNVSARNFKVAWDGTAYITDGEFSGRLHAKGGTIEGDFTVTGTLRGGSFYTDYLEANQGIIGGWTITRHALLSNSATLGADRSVAYPLSVGSGISEAERRFRVGWDGTAYIVNGEFSGYLKSERGIIGGWIINETTLSDQLGITILNSAETAAGGNGFGIITNRIGVVTSGSHDLGAVGGVMGSFTGLSDSGVTDVFGLSTMRSSSFEFSGSNIPIVIESSGGLRLTSGSNLYLNVGASTGSVIGTQVLVLSPGSGSGHIKCYAPPEEQEGFYARFA